MVLAEPCDDWPVAHELHSGAPRLELFDEPRITPLRASRVRRRRCSQLVKSNHIWIIRCLHDLELVNRIGEQQIL